MCYESSIFYSYYQSISDAVLVISLEKKHGNQSAKSMHNLIENFLLFSFYATGACDYIFCWLLREWVMLRRASGGNMGLEKRGGMKSAKNEHKIMSVKQLYKSSVKYTSPADFEDVPKGHKFQPDNKTRYSGSGRVLTLKEVFEDIKFVQPTESGCGEA